MTQQTLANEAVTAADAADGYESTYQRHSHRVVYSTVGPATPHRWLETLGNEARRLEVRRRVSPSLDAVEITLGSCTL